jgi:hypothetical protein
MFAFKMSGALFRSAAADGCRITIAERIRRERPRLLRCRDEILNQQRALKNRLAALNRELMVSDADGSEPTGPLGGLAAGRPGVGFFQRLTREQLRAFARYIVCPHCGREGHHGPMRRWHFEHCKRKPPEPATPPIAPPPGRQLIRRPGWLPIRRPTV